MTTDKSGWIIALLAVLMSPMAIVVGLFAVIVGFIGDGAKVERERQHARVEERERHARARRNE